MSKTFKSEGIVLKSLKYSETSLILDIYTKEKGLGSFIVSGVRKSKSRVSNVYQPCNILNLVAYRSEESLSRIKEAHYKVLFQKINLEVITSAVASFFVDLLRNSIKEKEANPHLYNFISSSLRSLDQATSPDPLIPQKLCIHLAEHLGFQIHDDFSNERNIFDLRQGKFVLGEVGHKDTFSMEHSEALHLLLNDQTLSMPKSIRQGLLDDLMLYYKYHVESFKNLKSLPVLRTILS